MDTFLSTHEGSKFQNHINNGGVTVRYKCNQCDENFLEIEDLKNHVSSNHQDFSQKTLINDSYKYVCSQCYLTFTNQNCLISHIESKHDMMEVLLRIISAQIIRNFHRKQMIL